LAITQFVGVVNSGMPQQVDLHQAVYLKINMRLK